MDSITQMPEWFGAAVIGAIIASLGYVAKQILSFWADSLSKYQANKANLLVLHSMLKASKVAFNYQKEIRGRLYDALENRDPALVADGGGFENYFTNAHATMTKEELELHTIIQAYTIYALYPLNQGILEWLKRETYYRSKKWELKNGKVLDSLLSELQGHLLLWVAKYKMWIPDQSAHALVYLADEKKHGLGFPNGIDDAITEVVSKRHWLFG